jgi:prolipoprotein diacylglyceryltransferase
MGVIVLLWAGHRFRLQWGRLFAFYLVWYSAGRIVWESIRIDPSEVFFGLRTNVWAAIFGVLVGIVIFACRPAATRARAVAVHARS